MGVFVGFVFSRKAAPKWTPYASLRTSPHAARSGRAPTSPRRARSLNARAAPKKERGFSRAGGAPALSGLFVYRWPRRLAERFLCDFRTRLRLLPERLLAARLLRLRPAPNPDRERDRDLGLLGFALTKRPRAPRLRELLRLRLATPKSVSLNSKFGIPAFLPEGFGVGSFSPKAVRFFFRPRDGPPATRRKKFVRQTRENNLRKKRNHAPGAPRRFHGVW